MTEDELPIDRVSASAGFLFKSGSVTRTVTACPGSQSPLGASISMDALLYVIITSALLAAYANVATLSATASSFVSIVETPSVSHDSNTPVFAPLSVIVTLLNPEVDVPTNMDALSTDRTQLSTHCLSNN